MASKRNLKKNFEYICGDVAGYCLFSEATMGADENKIGQVVVALAELQENAVKTVSTAYDHTLRDFPTGNAYRKARKAYYRQAYGKLVADFNARLDGLVKELNAAIPAEAKAQNAKK